MAKSRVGEERRKREAEVAAFVKERQLELADKASFKDNRLATEYLAKQEFVLERFEKIASKISSRNFVPDYKGKKGKAIQRIVNAQWSDLHFGADLDPRLTPFAYGETEERRRFAGVCAQLADYKRQYRAESSLHIHLIGDVIQGKLHDPQANAILTEQVDRASHHIVHGLDFLSSEYQEIIVDTSVGNHGRDVSRHPERATNDKYDSVEFRLYRLLYWTFRNHPRIKIRTPIRAFYLYDQFGMKGLMTHGDTIFNPGYPNRAIHVEALQNQINRYLVAGGHETLDVKLFGFGHVHVPMSMRLPGGQVLLTNGALIPSDEYAISIGIFNAPCSQNLWEAVPGYLFGDHRWMDVNSSHDQDKSLDKIIPPWKAFD
jgi:hypothetical protein